MAERKVLIDLNICLDTVLRRYPFAADALEITERSERGEFTGYIGAHGFDTIFFILERKLNAAKAYKAIKALRKAYQVAPVNTQTIERRSRWNGMILKTPSRNRQPAPAIVRRLLPVTKKIIRNRV